MGLLTQLDPIGIAGGYNLYGYANGDPINFSDPFGLCAGEEGKAETFDEDDRCWDTVALLRQVASALGRRAGRLFTNAADFLAGWQGGKVRWVDSGDPPLGPPADQTFGRAPFREDPDLYIAFDQKTGDFMMSAFHEVTHLDLGGGHGAQNRALTQRCRAAFRALPPALGSRYGPIGAPGHALPGNRIGC